MFFFLYKKGRQNNVRARTKRRKKNITQKEYSFDFIYISGAVFFILCFCFSLPRHLYLQLSLQTKRNHILLISMFVDLSLLDNHCGKRAHVNLILFWYVFMSKRAFCVCVLCVYLWKILITFRLFNSYIISIIYFFYIKIKSRRKIGFMFHGHIDYVHKSTLTINNTRTITANKKKNKMDNLLTIYHQMEQMHPLMFAFQFRDSSPQRKCDNAL